VLKRVARGWERDRVTVMRGSVRELEAGPNNVVVAVTTAEKGAVEVVLIEPSGRVRSHLYGRSTSVEEAETRCARDPASACFRAIRRSSLQLRAAYPQLA